jgi:hypothetical protein
LLRHELGHALNLFHAGKMCSGGSPNGGDPAGVSIPTVSVSDFGGSPFLVIETATPHGLTAGPAVIALANANVGGRTFNGLYTVAQVLTPTQFRTAAPDPGNDTDLPLTGAGSIILPLASYPEGGLMGINRSEMPNGEDIEGVQEVWRDTTFNLPGRAIKLSAGLIQSGLLGGTWIRTNTEALSVVIGPADGYVPSLLHVCQAMTSTALASAPRCPPAEHPKPPNPQPSSPAVHHNRCLGRWAEGACNRFHDTVGRCYCDDRARILVVGPRVGGRVFNPDVA